SRSAPIPKRRARHCFRRLRPQPRAPGAGGYLSGPPFIRRFLSQNPARLAYGSPLVAVSSSRAAMPGCRSRSESSGALFGADPARLELHALSREAERRPPDRRDSELPITRIFRKEKTHSRASARKKFGAAREFN